MQFPNARCASYCADETQKAYTQCKKKGARPHGVLQHLFPENLALFKATGATKFIRRCRFVWPSYSDMFWAAVYSPPPRRWQTKGKEREEVVRGRWTPRPMEGKAKGKEREVEREG